MIIRGLGGLESELSLMLKPKQIRLTQHALKRLRQRFHGRDMLNSLSNVLNLGNITTLKNGCLRISHKNSKVICKLIRDELVVLTFIDD